MALTDLWDRSSQRALPLWLPVAAVVLLVARVISSRYPVQADVDLVRWTPIERAEQMAKVAGKPVLYEFSAAWCGPCHVMEDEVFRDAELAALINERFIAVRVVDRERETGTNPPPVAALEARYHVQAFPTVVIARDGAAPAINVGYEGRESFEDFLRGAH